MIIRDPDEVEREAVELILTKPVFIGFSEETIRVRRNLLTIAFMVVVYKLSGLEIDYAKGFSFLGIKFKSAPINEFLDITLLCLIIYHFTHFIWQSIDACKEWRLRLTGTNELFMKNDIAKESSEDYALNPLQSSLLNWLWKRTKITADDYCTTSTNVLNAMTEESNRAISLKPTLESDALLNITNIHKAINDSRTLVSLKRFEDFHKCFCCSQRWRWLVIEFGTPVCLALFAIYQICQSYLLGWLNFPCL